MQINILVLINQFIFKTHIANYLQQDKYRTLVFWYCMFE